TGGRVRPVDGLLTARVEDTDLVLVTGQQRHTGKGRPRGDGGQARGDLDLDVGFLARGDELGPTARDEGIPGVEAGDPFTFPGVGERDAVEVVAAGVGLDHGHVLGAVLEDFGANTGELLGFRVSE